MILPSFEADLILEPADFNTSTNLASLTSSPFPFLTFKILKSLGLVEFLLIVLLQKNTSVSRKKKSKMIFKKLTLFYKKDNMGNNNNK